MVHGAITILLNMLASKCGMMYSTNVNTMDVVQMNTLCNVNILNSIISGTHSLYSFLTMTMASLWLYNINFLFTITVQFVINLQWHILSYLSTILIIAILANNSQKAYSISYQLVGQKSNLIFWLLITLQTAQ